MAIGITSLPGGRYLTVESISNALIYRSSNFGASWKPTSAPSNFWSSIATSATGTHLIAAASGGFIYVSANSGVTWTVAKASSNNWSAVASSAIGKNLFATAKGGLIYYSTDFGIKWLPAHAPPANWQSIACSADGRKVIAANSTQVWISKNSAATWTQTDLPAQNWNSVCSSFDGRRLIATGVSTLATVTTPSGRTITTGAIGGMGISTNAGASWTINTNFYATTVASSANGKKVFAVNNTGIYTSTNFGMTWTYQTNLTGSIACSADGNRAAIAVGRITEVLISLPDGRVISSYIPSAGPIYISSFRPIPSINMVRTNGHSMLSWFVPSTDYILQYSSDFSTWTNVTNQPVLNLTNLQNEVMLPMSNSSGFYRLKTP